LIVATQVERLARRPHLPPNRRVGQFLCWQCLERDADAA
jgi:hypothetical protein